MSDESLEIDGEEISLADLAGVEMDQVDEVRSVVTPAGLFHFKVKEATLDTMDTKDGKKAYVGFTLEIQNVLALVKEEDNNGNPIDADKLVGTSHSERFFISNPVEDLGRIKAFMSDTGFQGTGSLQELLDQFVDHEFQAAIKHRADKNDKDIVYANINRSKIAPIGSE